VFILGNFRHLGFFVSLSDIVIDYIRSSNCSFKIATSVYKLY
jgi:hypothetical protein